MTASGLDRGERCWPGYGLLGRGLPMVLVGLRDDLETSEGETKDRWGGRFMSLEEWCLQRRR